MRSGLAIRAPDHLGDATMAIPAIRGLAALGGVVHGPRFLPALFEAVGLVGVEIRGVDEVPGEGTGVLLKPSFGAAWRWRHLARRIGISEQGRGFLLTDALPILANEHRRDGYDRVARAAGAEVARGAVPSSRRSGFVALNPWSPSSTVRWPGFRALADQLVANGLEVRFFAGPGEEAAVSALAGPHAVEAGLPLLAFARALAGAALFVSNDSGAAHFADAVGVPVLVIHGSTDPALTGVGGAVTGGPIWCGPCYRKTCILGLTCLTRISPEVVVGAVLARLG